MLGSTSMETSMDTSSGNSWDGLLSSDNDAEVSIDRSASRQSVEEAGRPIYHRSAGASGMQGLSESLRSISLSIGESLPAFELTYLHADGYDSPRCLHFSISFAEGPRLTCDCHELIPLP